MEKEFIPYELALELKQLGFDKPCFAYYKDGRITGVNKWDREDWGFHVITSKEITSVTSEIVIAPTYSQAFRWFREKHNLEGEVHCIRFNSERLKGYQYSITSENYRKFEQLGYYHTYEEAELECLKKLIKIVKEGKK